MVKGSVQLQTILNKFVTWPPCLWNSSKGMEPSFKSFVREICKKISVLGRGMRAYKCKHNIDFSFPNEAVWMLHEP